MSEKAVPFTCREFWFSSISKWAVLEDEIRNGDISPDAFSVEEYKTGFIFIKADLHLVSI